MDGLKRYPQEQDLSEVARAAFDALANYTSFPWPVLKTQCGRAGLDPAQLDREGLARILDMLATGVERFTSPDKGQAVRASLTAIVER